MSTPFVARRYIAALVAFVLAMTADIITTAICLHSGLTREGDPIAARAFSDFGLGISVVVLIAATAVALGGYCLAKRYDWRLLTFLITLVLWVAALSHLAGAISNIVLMFHTGIA